MNKVILIGNLTKDPELRETPSGVTVCHFSLAVTRAYTNDGERKTDFFNCVAWRGLGENLARYQKKGSKISIVGSIEFRDYEDRDGIKRTAVDIVAQDIEFLSSRAADESSDEPRRTRPTLQAMNDDNDIPF